MLMQEELVKEKTGESEETMSQVESCQTCLYYYNNFAPNPLGICRRFPPVQYLDEWDDERGCHSLYPEVNETDWCGEYQHD